MKVQFTSKRLLATLLSVGVGAAVAPGLLRPVSASDHIDSPQLANDHASDINDVWAFLDPNDNSKVVLIISTNPFLLSSEIIGQAIFDHNLRYRFEIENTGDAEPDLYIDVAYTRGLGRLTSQTATVSIENRRGARRQPIKPFTAQTTVNTEEDTPPEPVITTDPASGISFFAGAVDDPFFLDNTAANRFVLSSIANPGHPDRSVFRRGRDTYAGFNTLVTVLSVPAALLKGDGNVIGINCVTQRQSTQRVLKNGQVAGRGSKYYNLDRQGLPLVNNGLIPAPRKDEYNSASTVDDAKGRFAADIRQSLLNFGTDEAHIDQFMNMAVRNGDILRLDLSIANTGPGGGTNPEAAFPLSGRRLQDDVPDTVFTLINNGVPLSDNVNANDAQFRNQFPFVASPIQPNPLGVDNPDDRTRL